MSLFQNNIYIINANANIMTAYSKLIKIGNEGKFLNNYYKFWHCKISNNKEQGKQFKYNGTLHRIHI
jgi:hypothetical protein